MVQSESPRPILDLELPCDPSAPRVVRDALHELDWLGWVLGDVTLVASELVANAVTHSGCSVTDTLSVHAELAEDHLRIAVRDPGRSGSVAHVREGDPEAGGGWGLLIVEQLSEQWGCESRDGQLVWADVALPAPVTRPENAPPRATAGSPGAASATRVGVEREGSVSRLAPAARGSARPGD